MRVFCGDEMIRSFLYVPAASMSFNCCCKMVRKQFVAADDDDLCLASICRMQRATVDTTNIK